MEPRGDGDVKLELDDQELRAVGKSLAERKARLVEIVHDTTLHPATRRAGVREQEVVASILRKLRKSEGTCVTKR